MQAFFSAKGRRYGESLERIADAFEQRRPALNSLVIQTGAWSFALVANGFPCTAVRSVCQSAQDQEKTANSFIRWGASAATLVLPALPACR